MKHSCADFRADLEAILVQRGRRLSEGGQAHLRACAQCRALLREEQALESLLAALPEPRLPAALVERVLARLLSERRNAAEHAGAAPREASLETSLEASLQTSLDQFLEQAAQVEVPEGLSERVLQQLAGARHAQLLRAQQLDQALDALLELERPPRPPPQLAARVLASLEPARPVLLAARRRRQQWRVAAAAVLLAGVTLSFFLWRMLRRASPPAAPVAERHLGPVDARDEFPAPPPREPQTAVALPALPPALEPELEASPELLAQLDLLERWDLLLNEDVELLLASLEAEDELLLEYEAQRSPATQDPPGAAGPAPKALPESVEPPAGGASQG